MTAATTFEFAMACGVAGAFVNVSEYVLFNEGGVTRNSGRQSSFVDTRPGSFAFTLDNSDGRFTPGNVASALGTPLFEGMRVSWQLNDRIVSGRVRSFSMVFADISNAESARVRVACDDVLGQAGRVTLGSLPQSLVEAAGPLGYWKFDEPVGSVAAADSGPYALPSFRAASSLPYVPTFGATELDWVGDTQAQGGGSASLDSRFETNIPATNFGYAANEAGAYGFWWTPVTPSGDGSNYFQFRVFTQGGNYFSVEAGFNDGDQLGVTVNNSALRSSSELPLNVPVYVSLVPTIVGSYLSVALFVDGVLAATRTRAHTGDVTAAGLAPKKIELIMRSSSGAASEFRISRITHTLTRVNENLIVDPEMTESELLNLFATIVPAVTLGTLPTELSTAPVAVDTTTTGQSALSFLNSIIATEQGYAYAETTGTLLNPVEKIIIRQRERPLTVTETFTTTTDILGSPSLSRDITDTLSSVTVNGYKQTAIATDNALTKFVGSASRTETVLNTRQSDLRMWGHDRLYRGAPEGINVDRVTIDARSTNSDRWADLLALKEGDRIRVAGLPATQLGFTTYDGWLVGSGERHDADRDLFDLYLTPAPASYGYYGTSLYMAGGDLTLSSSINSSATSISVATSSLAKLTTTETPFTIQFGREQLTVTAVTGATPQVLTVVRGANGTPASSHTAGAVLEVLPSAVYAF